MNINLLDYTTVVDGHAVIYLEDAKRLVNDVLEQTRKAIIADLKKHLDSNTKD